MSEHCISALGHSRGRGRVSGVPQRVLGNPRGRLGGPLAVSDGRWRALGGLQGISGILWDSSGEPEGSFGAPLGCPRSAPWGSLGVCATPRVALREALGVFGETSGNLREASGVLGEAQEASRACKADRGNVQKTCVFTLLFAYEVVGQSSGGPQKAFGWPPRALGRPRGLLMKSWVSLWAVLGGRRGSLGRLRGSFGHSREVFGGPGGSSGCLGLRLGSRCVAF